MQQLPLPLEFSLKIKKIKRKVVYITETVLDRATEICSIQVSSGEALGFAYCHPTDEYNEKIAIKLARRRAKKALRKRKTELFNSMPLLKYCFLPK